MIYNKDFLGNTIEIGCTVIIPQRTSVKFPMVTEGSIKLAKMTVVDIKPTERHFWDNCNDVRIPNIILRDSKGKLKEFKYPRSCLVVKEDN